MQWNSETSGISPTLKKIARVLLPIGQLPFSQLIADGGLAELVWSLLSVARRHGMICGGT